MKTGRGAEEIFLGAFQGARARTRCLKLCRGFGCLDCLGHGWVPRCSVVLCRCKHSQQGTCSSAAVAQSGRWLRKVVGPVVQGTAGLCPRKAHHFQLVHCLQVCTWAGHSMGMPTLGKANQPWTQLQPECSALCTHCWDPSPSPWCPAPRQHLTAGQKPFQTCAVHLPGCQHPRTT